MLLDHRYGQSFPAGLTCMPAKATLYSLDSHFWEAWEDLGGIAGQSALELARAHSLHFMEAPPGNALKEYDGAWHVRINKQWRLTFM